VYLEFFLEPFVKLRQFLLTLALEFLPQRPLQPSALLPIANFELLPSSFIETQTGLPYRRLYLAPDLLLPHSLPFPQDLLLLGIHLQPALRIPLEHLVVLRSKVQSWGRTPKLARSPEHCAALISLPLLSLNPLLSLSQGRLRKQT
jgi:hypothetical protein